MAGYYYSPAKRVLALAGEKRDFPLTVRRVCFSFSVGGNLGRLIRSMAYLEHFSEAGRDCFRLRFQIDRKRCSVGLGEFDETKAIEAKEIIEHILVKRKLDRLPDRKAVQWLDKLPSEIHRKLAAIGLAEARDESELPRMMIAFMRAYIAKRTDWKKSVNHKQSVDHLETFIGRDVPLSSFSAGKAAEFHRWMMKPKDAKQGTPGLSANTAGQHVKRCRQMMREAMKYRLAEENPFAGIKVDLNSDTSKDTFIDETTALAVLDACPDQEWRTLFALCRWGGLRNPSETLLLRWSDIQWERGRMKVRSPKTEKAGKAERIVPLFPEVLRELQSQLELVDENDKGPKNQYVIGTYRDTEANLRKMLGRIADKAGVKRWRKPFIALRKSRRNELQRSGRFTHNVLNDWFGHTGEVADKNYLQSIEEDFMRAAALPPPAVGQSVGQSAEIESLLRCYEKLDGEGKKALLQIAKAMTQSVKR
jgi:integrase